MFVWELSCRWQYCKNQVIDRKRKTLLSIADIAKLTKCGHRQLQFTICGLRCLWRQYGVLSEHCCPRSLTKIGATQFEQLSTNSLFWHMMSTKSVFFFRFVQFYGLNSMFNSYGHMLPFWRRESHMRSWHLLPSSFLTVVRRNHSWNTNSCRL